LGKGNENKILGGAILMNSQKIDKKKMNDLTENTPSDEVLSTVTPLKIAFRSLLTGVVLYSFTINIWYLQYILPSIGVILILIGMRMIRNNNCWLYVGYVFASLNLARWIAYLFIESTLNVQKELVINAEFVIGACIRICLFFLLYLGVRKEINKIGEAKQSSAILWLTILFILIPITSQTPLSKFPPVYIVIFFFLIIIFINMKKLFSEIEESGYELRAAPIRIKNMALFCIILSSMFIEVTITCVYVHYDFMSGTQIVDMKSDPNETIRNKLINMGTSEEIALALQEQELANIADAQSCMSKSETITVQNKKVVITNIYFYVQKNEVYGVTYFKWLSTSKIFFEDMVNLEMGYRITPIGGKIFYDIDQKKYEKNLNELKNMPTDVSKESIDELLHISQDSSKYIYADFNYPWNSKNQRGYIMYRFDASKGLASTTLVNYYRRENPYNFPNKEIMNLNVYLHGNVTTQSNSINFDPWF